MATFCYKTIDDAQEIVERSFPCGEAPLTIRLADGRAAKRNHAAEMYNRAKNGQGWPIECFASGVEPEQAQALRDLLRRKGVPTDVTPDGDPVYRDASHRKKALKARGLIDRQSFI